MPENPIERIIAKTFMEIADGLEKGSFSEPIRIAVTGIGSEHGEENVLKGAVLARSLGIDVTYIGTLTAKGITTEKAETEEEARKIMEALLESNKVHGAVTMHYPFPIGVATVGRVITPGMGKEMFIAATTGASSSGRAEGMILNAIYGIITAKACGIQKPTVGILNIDGARQAERALKQLNKNGYEINFAESARSDKGSVMRGNDLLSGECDVMVCDSLTGNIIMKMMSSFNTGGNYEALGYGYGPGIGEDYDKLVMIVSRASGAPVIAGAIQYAAHLIKGDFRGITKDELAKAKIAGLYSLLKDRTLVLNESPEKPPKEVVVYQISGVDIMDIDEAVKTLWQSGIYAESGMGCTGPIILVNEAKAQKAEELCARVVGLVDSYAFKKT